MTTRETRCLAVTIDAPFEAVCSDLADPSTHPQWATEFFSDGAAVPVANGVYRLTAPMMGGPVLARTDAQPDLGSIDLYLAPEGAPFGEPLPIRVIRNGSGVDVLWTLNRPDGLPDVAWQGGLASMERELDALRIRHEQPGH
jgi:hypothetical protein